MIFAFLKYFTIVQEQHLNNNNNNNNNNRKSYYAIFKIDWI